MASTTFYVCSDSKEINEQSVRQFLEHSGKSSTIDAIVIDTLAHNTPVNKRGGLIRLTRSLGPGDKLVCARLGGLGADARDVLSVIYKMTKRGTGVYLLDFPELDITSEAAKVHRAVLSSLVTLDGEDRIFLPLPKLQNK